MLKEVTLKTRKVLSQKTLDRKPNGLGKRRRKDGENLASRSENLKKELKTATKRSARLEKDVRGDRTRQTTKRRTAEKRFSSGSAGSPEYNGSPEGRSLAHSQRK